MATRPAQKLAEKQAENDPVEKKSTAIPDNALRPQDHKSAKSDVVPDDTRVVFEYEDHKYTLLADAYDTAQDIDWLEKLQDGNLIGPVRDLLGFEEWTRAKKNLRPEEGPFRQELLQPFFETMMKELRAKNS